MFERKKLLDITGTGAVREKVSEKTEGKFLERDFFCIFLIVLASRQRTKDLEKVSDLCSIQWFGLFGVRGTMRFLIISRRTHWS
jgi:hypothetical protein